MLRLAATLAALSALLVPTVALAAQATIAWDPDAEPTIAGYKLSIGPASQPFPPPIDVGNVSSHTVPGLDPAVAYHAAVSSYDDLGQESPLSDELFFTPSENSDPGGDPPPDVGPIDPIPPPDPLLFADDFSDSGTRGDPSWTTVRGRWSGTPRQTYVSSGRRVDLALVAAPGGEDFQAGRIESRISLSGKNTKSPNAEIVFHYQDPAHYRYLRLTPKGLVLGQVGVFSGEPGGVKARRSLRVSVRPWHHVRLDVEGGTLVKVYVDGLRTPSIAYSFATGASGGVGYQTRGSRSGFDDAAIWSDLALR